MSFYGERVRISASFLRKGAAAFICALFSLPVSARRYHISEVTYALERTREDALARNVEVDTDRIFESREELDSYLADLNQRILNTRVFQDALCDVRPVPDGDGEDGITELSLRIEATDSRHLLILPYPKYDSNDGLILKIKIKDVNFLGTMSVLDAGIFAGIKEDAESGDQNPTFGAEFSYRHPFTLGPFLGSWNNNLDFQYTCGARELEFWSGTGLTFELPFKKLSLVLDVSERANRDLEYEEFGDAGHLTSEMRLSVPVKILEIGDWGTLFWTPFTDGKVSYDKDGINHHNDDLASPVVCAGQALSASRIDWHGNFRTGLSAKIGHSAGYDFMQKEIERQVFGEILLFKGFGFIAFSTRLTAFMTKSNRSLVGGLVRGVRDKQRYLNDTHKALKTPSAIVLNADIPVHLITTDWAAWTERIFGAGSGIAEILSWTGKFNFELQAAPFIDIALTKNEMTGRLFSPKDGWYTGGIEFLVFPERWKGIVIRGSFGVDLGRALVSKKFPDKIDMGWRENVKKYEIYAGIGLHY